MARRQRTSFRAITVNEFLRDVVAGFPDFVSAVRDDWPMGPSHIAS